MIDRFQEHAANERTFLSWVRTAVAVAGFGVLVERLPNQATTGWTGPVLVGLSTILVALATLRFLVIRRQIGRTRPDSGAFAKVEALFALMLAFLLAVLFFYLLGLVRG